AIEPCDVGSRSTLASVGQQHIPKVLQVQKPGCLIVIVQSRDRYVGLDEMVKNIDEGEFGDRDRCTADRLLRLFEGLGLRELHEHEGPRRTADQLRPEVAAVGGVSCKGGQREAFSHKW